MYKLIVRETINVFIFHTARRMIILYVIGCSDFHLK